MKNQNTETNFVEHLANQKIVDVNIRRLRIKIEDDTANPLYITTVWGIGYKWGA